MDSPAGLQSQSPRLCKTYQSPPPPAGSDEVAGPVSGNFRPLNPTEELMREVKTTYKNLNAAKATCKSLLSLANCRLRGCRDPRPEDDNRELRHLVSNRNAHNGLRERIFSPEYDLLGAMWKHGIGTLLEIFRKHIPDSGKIRDDFTYQAAKILEELCGSVRAYSAFWYECLGKIGLFRLKYEGEEACRQKLIRDCHDYFHKSSERAPTRGSNYHGLATLADLDPIEELFYLIKSQSVPHIYMEEDTAIGLFLRRILAQVESTPGEDRNPVQQSPAQHNDLLFVQVHGIIATASIATQVPDGCHVRMFKTPSANPSHLEPSKLTRYRCLIANTSFCILRMYLYALSSASSSVSADQMSTGAPDHDPTHGDASVRAVTDMKPQANAGVSKSVQPEVDGAQDVLEDASDADTTPMMVIDLVEEKTGETADKRTVDSSDTAEGARTSTKSLAASTDLLKPLGTRSTATRQLGKPSPPRTREEAHLLLARHFNIAIVAAVFDQAGNENILLFLYTTLRFVAWAIDKGDVDALLGPGFPWSGLANCLNSVFVANSTLRRIHEGAYVADTNLSSQPSLADYHAMGLPWAGGFFPKPPTAADEDEVEGFMDDREEMVVRCTVLGVEIAGLCEYLCVDIDKWTFTGVE
ncbi:unnamed protein product [Cyclocybe aegerita]|uniref:Uncharacterized protein n=1 Tax=Cyclocybe aegerita TaxID=1973307 RepID=A0A8S0WUF5_CYCAE|nr:unnamed protein product [Cyclocybe aegerita]